MTATIRVQRTNGTTEDVILGFGNHLIGRETPPFLLGDPNVSSTHAYIHIGAHSITITDAGSRNGIFDARGERVTGPLPLQMESPIRIGDSILTLVGFIPQSGGTVLVTDQRIPPVPGVGQYPQPASHPVPLVLHSSTSRRPDGQGSSDVKKWGMVGGSILIGLVVVGLVMGDDRLSESVLENAINEGLERKGEICEMPLAHGTTFPAKVHRVPPVFKVLEDEGYLSITHMENMMGLNFYVLDLTEEGRKKEVWDRDKGICFGRPRVHEITRWSEPQEGAAQEVEVTYTWRYDPVRPWIDVSDDEFEDAPGFGKPVESKAMVRKMSDGWRVTH